MIDNNIHYHTHFETTPFLELINVSKAVGRDSLAYLSLLKREKPNITELQSKGDQLQRTINEMNREATVCLL